VKDERNSREVLDIELSPAMREAARRADELKAFCKNNQLSLAAIVAEESAKHGAIWLHGNNRHLAQCIDDMARRFVDLVLPGEDNDVRPS
jgi:hypothetical protein